MADDLDPERSTILNRIRNGLTQVWPAKPIGYLPLYTIHDVLQMDPHALAQDAEANGLSAILVAPDQCCIKSGALYIFDRQSLEKMLQSYRPILQTSDWPLDPDQFVARIAREWIDPAHSVAPVIRHAFGEDAV